MNRYCLGLLAVVVAPSLFGCPERARRYDRLLDVEGPIVVGERLAYLNKSAQTVIVLTPGDDQPRAIEIGAFPRTLVATGDRLLALAGTGQDPVLEVVDATNGAVESIVLAGAYDRIFVTGSGAHAVLSFDPTASVVPGGAAARNNNEISIVDLGASSAIRLSLDTESLSPSGVTFHPARPLAAISLDSAIAIVDLAAPDRRVRVPLKLSNGDALSPIEAIFSPSGDHLFVRALGSDDVLAIAIEDDATALRASINFLFHPGVQGLRDIAVPAGMGDRVAAIYAAEGLSSAVLFEPDGLVSSNEATDLDFEARSIADLGDGRLVLFGAAERRVAVWEPLEGRVDQDRFAGEFTGSPRIGGGSAFFQHSSIVVAGGGATPALTGLRAEERDSRVRVRLSPIVLGGPATAAQIDPSGEWLVVGVTVPRQDSGAAPLDDDEDDFSGSTGSLVVVQTETLELFGLPLDHEILDVGVVGEHIFATHPNPLGEVTFVPLSDLRREAAVRHDGFLLGGSLDLALEEES